MARVVLRVFRESCPAALSVSEDPFRIPSHLSQAFITEVDDHSHSFWLCDSCKPDGSQRATCILPLVEPSAGPLLIQMYHLSLVGVTALTAGYSSISWGVLFCCLIQIVSCVL